MKHISFVGNRPLNDLTSEERERFENNVLKRIEARGYKIHKKNIASSTDNRGDKGEQKVI